MFKVITKDSQFGKPLILISSDDTRLLTNKNMMSIKGETGSGKSRLAMNIMRGFLTGYDAIGFEYLKCPLDKVVVYVNTEMDEYDLQNRLLQILKLCDTQSVEQLVFIDERLSDDLIKQIDKIAKHYNTHCIIIDQIGDGFNDMNNLQEAKKHTDSLMNIAEKNNTALIILAHQNPNSGINGKINGHGGTLLERKVICSLAICSTSYGFIIKSTKMRHGKPIKIFVEFDQETEMLKLSDKKDIDYSLITNKLILPSPKTDVYKQIETITKLKSPVKQQKILDDLIEMDLVEIIQEGKSKIVNLKS